MRPRFVLFGTPALEHEGRTESFVFERRSQLVALLALEGGWVTRARFAALLWPEQSDELAHTNLRKALFRLRSLPWAQAIEVQASALRLNAATDVGDFEAALAQGRVDEALAYVRGELLAGFDDPRSEPWTQWLRFERERVRGAWRGAAIERASAIDAPAAVTLTARLLEADSLDETALRAHMHALARDGQATAAQQAYQRFAARLAHELRIEPDAQSQALHESLGGPGRGRAANLVRADVPSHASHATHASHVSQASRDADFVGRGVEVQRIGELLARDECRLLCLVGPGGVGKTRLARRAMAALAERFADGAWFVELEDAESVPQAAQRIADTLDVRAGKDALAATVAALRGRESLVVLDNVEPFADDAAALLEPLLAAAPRMKVLLTSRVRLPIAQAWSMPLAGLPVPDPEDDDRAETFDAIRLFVHAARRVAPDLLWSVERAAIVDICRQVEGLPLAIELAAAWTRVLPCADIAAELRHGHELLRVQDASHPARHASIGVVFDESWRRLTDAERRVLARLSPFRGGFTVDAARAVTGAALPVLGALVDKSLLRKDGPRLALHPMLQVLAAAKLDAESDRASAAAATAHAAFFHAWLHRARAAAERGEATALAAIEAEIDNCRQAWTTSIADGDADAIMRSAATLFGFVEHRARFADGLAMWLEAIDSPLAAAQRPLRVLLLAQAALFEYRLARFDAAQSRAELALAQSTRGAADLDARWQALAVLASCAMSTGRFADARRLFLRTLALARARAGAWAIARTLENLALASKRLGRYDESLRLNLEALVEHRRSGAGASVALSLSNLASLEMALGRLETASDHLREALALTEQLGLTSTQVLVRSNLTELAMHTHDLAQARTHAERALEIAQGVGMRAQAGWLELQLARLSAHDGRLEEARARLAAGCALALELHQPSLAAAALMSLAELLEALGRPAAARRVLWFGVEQTSLSAPDRDELRIQWARRASAGRTEPPWPGPSLDGLLQRVVAEATSPHVALMAELT